MNYNTADLMLAVLSQLDQPPYTIGVISGCAYTIAFGEKYKRLDLVEKARQVQENAVNYLVKEATCLK